MTNHSRFMRVALSLARRNLGQTAPNPSVGAVLVKHGHIIATGITGKGGRPHAETQALEQTGDAAKGATLYVTLEPCSHHGKTPPCAEAIIRSGIATVVIAYRDPNPKVNGAGVETLKKSGIEVIEGVCEKEALEVNRCFFSLIQKNRPYIALKIATSLDGKITHPHPTPLPHAGEGSTQSVRVREWLTGEPARAYGQLLRAQHDAILTGSGTVLTDNPQLTCRLPGLEEHSPQRFVLDRQNRTPKNAAIHPATLLQDHTIEEVIATLAEKGITRLMVEAGATLSTAFLQSGLVDRIYWFRAPIIVGDQGLTAFSEPLAGFVHTGHTHIGKDTLEIYECSPAS